MSYKHNITLYKNKKLVFPTIEHEFSISIRENTKLSLVKTLFSFGRTLTDAMAKFSLKILVRFILPFEHDVMPFLRQFEKVPC